MSAAIANRKKSRNRLPSMNSRATVVGAEYQRRLCCEMLEDRRLLSVSPTTFLEAGPKSDTTAAVTGFRLAADSGRLSRKPKS